mmetsp:Transcript_29201/g.33522  ORF Transcript_29201/g.33522 Transcript_29201/m.33522 type:complete len:84 (-) Transcript_29201:319-570(-)
MVIFGHRFQYNKDQEKINPKNHSSTQALHDTYFRNSIIPTENANKDTLKGKDEIFAVSSKWITLQYAVESGIGIHQCFTIDRT